MTSISDSGSQALQQMTKQFDDRMRLARTCELARDGRLLEAEALLCSDGKVPQSITELDLLARIHVLQGRYEEAKRRWRDAVKIDGEKRYDEFIELLDRWLTYRHQLLIWRMKLAGLLLLILGVFSALYKLGFNGN